jgi:hypothetical protein
MFGKALGADELAMKVLILLVLTPIFPSRSMLVLRLLKLQMVSLKIGCLKMRSRQM